MANDEHPLDETAISAVSSLLSRFENLATRSALSRPAFLKSTSAAGNVNGRPPTIPKKPSFSDSPRPRSFVEPAADSLRPSLDFASLRSSFEERRPEIANTAAERSVKSKPQVPQKKLNLLSRVDVKGNGKSEAVSKTEQESIASPIVEDNVLRRGRNTSDASWVERLRADSDASSRGASPIISRRLSPKKLTRPSRVDSNASWVEASDLAEPRSAVTDDNHEDYAGESGPSKKIGAPKLLLCPVVQPETIPEVVRLSLDRNRALDHPARSSSLPDQRPALPSRPTDPVKSIPVHAQTLDTPRSVYNTISSAASSTVSLNTPPAVPPSRRSLDRRKEPPVDKPLTLVHNDLQPLTKLTTMTKAASDASLAEKNVEPAIVTFPDISTFNSRPPKWQTRPSQINTEYDTRLLAVSDDYACTSGHITRVWNLRTGNLLVNIPHPEGMKVTAICFLPVTGDGQRRLWLGSNTGDIHEVDVAVQRITDTSQRAHRGREIIKVYNHQSNVCSLDDSGNLAIWYGAKGQSPSLQSQFQLFRTQRGHTASIVCDNRLWLATGKEIRIYQPAARTEDDFSIGEVSLHQMNIGDVTTMATIQGRRNNLYLGHTDGKISLFDRNWFNCLGIVHVSLNKVGLLHSVGSYLWAGFSSGVMQVYDTSQTPWTTKKEWQAHTKTITGMAHDPVHADAAFRVVTLGADAALKIWDGLFEEDWLDEKLQLRDSTFCDFNEIKVSILTWNAGASKPAHLQNRIEDDSFLRDYISENSRSDIFVFGFQELVDLEDKKLTAKSFFRSKKKDAFEQEHMSHQYRAWQNHLNLRMQEYASYEVVNLHTASMIGLFTCVFIKASLQKHIRHVHQAEVKRGMGGLYGNKGALVLRFIFDDSSICFVNCHLAAGQTKTADRNSDAAAVLEAECLPAYPLERHSEIEHGDVFPTGGNGSTVLDHELCILNGDLNYRIDTMSRDTVVKYVDQGNLSRLLERDQLLLSRKKNPGLKLRAFQEKPIQFSPTYKYNVNSNEYDTSEKRRSPAWCDRVLFRGLGKIRCDQYRRWEVRVSDHRPVSALLTCRVKTVDPERRAQVLQQCTKEFLIYKRQAERTSQAGPW